MSYLIISPTVYAAVGTTSLLAYLLYRAALPKPTLGIPYRKNSAKSIWADITDMLKRVKSDSDTVPQWFAARAIELDSPIYQLFLFLFTSPTVIVTDHREGSDIMLRRKKSSIAPIC
ncbi:hypothetical protein K461DRAFT_297913 [Myriangium duriaei CBS 260.36]|uniref:Uncharacterized protein n=1 Tax=Myriangium duriaei CBS 260.36 TaxID=1168546 RepID=A0A9P4IRR9_9PEZI|nr:hypothetical protein K461DRAFT_297913 [Myriangium duriaei CBS 260.36]